MGKQTNASGAIDLNRLRHKAERPLNIISLLFSLAVYVILTVLAVRALDDPEKAGQLIEFLEAEDGDSLLFQCGVFFVLVILVVTFIKILWGFFINLGETVSCDLPVSDRQFANLNEICSSYAGKLGLKFVPGLYISEDGQAEAEASSVTVKSTLYIRLDCYNMLVAKDLDDYTAARFMIASELAHIALGHRNILWVLLTLPARMLPIYKDLVFRAMNYSADRVAAELTGAKEAIDAIIVLANDPYMAAEIDKDAYIRDIMRSESGLHSSSRFYYNLLSDEPIPAYRIAALSDPSKKDGRLF